MNEIKFRGKNIHTHGDLPMLGEPAPNFVLTQTDLTTVNLEDFLGQPNLLNVYPSIDTAVCFESVQRFKSLLDESEKPANIICVSMDTPFALQRIHQGECLSDIQLLSDIRNREFGETYGVTISDGILAGFLARSVFVIDSRGFLQYAELVSDISQHPNYEQAFAAIAACE